MLNKVIIEGRLTKDPVMEQSYSGTSYCNFSIACERRFANKEDGKHETDFFHLVSWRKTAEFIGRHFKKGDPILIVGRLQTSKYTDKDGNSRIATNIVVEEANFALSKKRDADSGNQSDTQTPQ